MEKTMRTTILMAMAALLLGGCATVTKQQATYQTGRFPEPGEITSVNVGQVMVTAYDYLADVSAITRVPVEGSYWAGRQGVAVGTKLYSAISNGRQVFCVPPGTIGQPCLADTDDDGAFDQASTFNAYGMLVNERDVPPVAFKLATEAIADGFKYELLYQGIHDGVIRIAYREFTENLARPAFAQDLTYTLGAEGDTTIAFREVSIAVHRADNNQIHYTVRSGFTGAP
jgi:hypothetical protein